MNPISACPLCGLVHNLPRGVPIPRPSAHSVLPLDCGNGQHDTLWSEMIDPPMIAAIVGTVSILVAIGMAFR